MNQNHFGKGDNVGRDKVINISKLKIKWLIPIFILMGILITLGHDKLSLGINQLESKVSRVEGMVEESKQIMNDLKNKNKELKEEIQKTNLILNRDEYDKSKIDNNKFPNDGSFSGSQSRLEMLTQRKSELRNLIISTKTIIIKNKIKALESTSQRDKEELNEIIKKLENNVLQLERQFSAVEKEILIIQNKTDENIINAFQKMG
jgi:predicted  nucleic acid-binding Zn-ribbon protein